MQSANNNDDMACARVEQIDLLYAQSTTTLLSSLVAAVALGLAHREVLGSAYVPWLIALSLLVAVRIIVSAVYRSHRERGADPAPWVLPFLACAGLNGVLWGAGFPILFTPSDPGLVTLLLVTLAGIIGGGAVALSSIRAAPPTFVTPICVLVAVTLFNEGTELNLWLGLASLLYGVFMLRLGQRSYETTLSSLLLRHQNESLLHAVERAKAETDSLNRELAAANKEALRALEAKSTFLATMSHEIRTPMNGVLGMADLLRNEPLDRRQHHLVQTLHRSGEALLNIINDTLDFSRIESGRFELDEVPFSLHDILEDVAELLAINAHAKGIGLTLVVPAGLPAPLLGDPGRLRQVLMNIAGNAVKFTDRGEVGIRVNMERAPGDGVALRIDIADTGAGISAEAQDHIFEAFAQASRETAGRFGGTGLGLAISRQLVEMMGGTISVRSEPHVGSTFTVTLELARATASEAQGSTAPTQTCPEIGVIVVSDNTGIREGLSELLRAMGIPHASHASGRDALLNLGVGVVDETPVRLLLVDAQLDDMTGLELARRLRPETASGPVEVLMLCASGDETTWHDAWAAHGISGHLHKPVRRSTMAEAFAAVGCGATPEPTQAGEAGRAALVGHVLVAEDQPVNREIVLEMLNTAGLRVTTAENGREAIDAFCGADFDLILMDCQMPELDGFGATAEIRRIESERGVAVRTPIIALTADALKGVEEACLSAGMDDYLTKPISTARLHDAVRRWLGTDANASDPPLPGPGRAAMTA